MSDPIRRAFVTFVRDVLPYCDTAVAQAIRAELTTRELSEGVPADDLRPIKVDFYPGHVGVHIDDRERLFHWLQWNYPHVVHHPMEYETFIAGMLSAVEDGAMDPPPGVARVTVAPWLILKISNAGPAITKAAS